MAEEVVNTETPTEVVDGGNLPSENVPADYSGFDLNDDVKGKFKDGKLNGRFGSLNEVLDKLKEAEDFRANTIRDQKTIDDKTVVEGQEKIDKAATVQKQDAVVKELIPAFLENGMVLTPEMEAKATEAGIDIRDLKLGAIDFRDRTNSAHALTGGKENYDAMIEYSRGVLTPAQQASFDKDLATGMGEYAIKGLYADFKAADESGEVGRIEGNVAFTGVKPYENRRDLYKDKDYIESPAGRRDAAAQKMYRARLGKTNDSVIYGRQ